MAAQRGFITVIISFIIFFILIGAGVFFYLNRNMFIPAPVPKVKPVALDHIKDHVSFTVPVGWKEQTESENNNIIFKSSDLLITINRTAGDPRKALDLALHPEGEQASFNSDITESSISGMPSVSYHNNYEQHDKSFVIGQEPNFVWQIAISSRDQSIEDRHKTEIDSFIHSVVIK